MLMPQFPLLPASDAILVQAALKDQPSAFEQLVLRYQKKAYAIARAIGVPPPALEDIVQESFLKAFEHLPQLRQHESFGLWFLNIVRNTSRRFMERKRSRPNCPLPDWVKGDEGETLEQKEFRELLWKRVEEMPESIREAVFLYYHEGKSVREVTRALGISRFAVLKRIQRGRDFLREKLWRELEDTLREILPSTREWNRKGRQLAFVVMTGVAASWGIRATAAVTAGGGCAVGDLLTEEAARETGLFANLASGIFEVTGKKLLISLLALCALLGGILFFTLQKPSPPRDQGEGSGRPAETASREKGGSEVEGASTPMVAVKEKKEGPGQLPEIPAIVGQVTDRQGKGIPGARLIAVNREEWFSGIRTIGFEEILLDNSPARSKGDAFWLQGCIREYRSLAEKFPSTSTDGEGRYEFRGLEDGIYRVHVTASGFCAGKTNSVAVGPDRPARCDMDLVPAAAIAGRILDEGGRAVPDASVSIAPSSRRRLSEESKKVLLACDLLRGIPVLAVNRMESSTSGAFRFEGLRFEAFDISVRKAGFLEVQVLDVQGETQEVVVTLSAGLCVRGRVIGPDRRPVVGATVVVEDPSPRAWRPVVLRKTLDSGMAQSLDFDPEPERSGETGPSGEFEIWGLRAGPYRIAAKKEGLGSREVEVKLRDTSVDLGEVALGSPLAIAGWIRGSGGGALAGARIWIEEAKRNGIEEVGGVRCLQSPVLVEARSGPDGAFRLEGLPEGMFTVRAASGDHAPVVVPGIRAGTESVELILSRGWSVSGQVVDERDGLPVQGAEVVLVQGGLNDIPVPEKGSITDARGRFELQGVGFDQPDLAIRVSCAGYGKPQEIRLRKEEVSDLLRIVLVPPDSITGKVLDSEGGPVAGARIEFRAPASNAAWFMRENGRQNNDEILSKEDGSFDLNLARPIRERVAFLEIVARHEGRGGGTVIASQPTDRDKAWQPVEIHLLPFSSLSGKAVDSMGIPIPVATVELYWMVTGPGGQTHRVTGTSGACDAEGQFRFPQLIQGQYELEGRAPGFQPRRISGVDLLMDPREETIVLEPGLSIKGRVIDDSGQGVTGAEVFVLELHRADRDGGEELREVRRIRREQTGGLFSSSTGEDGRYELRDLPEGELTLVARAPGYEPSQLIVVRSGGTSADLVLTRLAVLEGKVQDAERGSPVSLFTVYAMAFSGDGAEDPLVLLPRQYDSPAGRFAIDAMKPGRYLVHVAARGYGYWRGEVMLEPGKETSIAVVLQKGKTLRGAVVDCDAGTPIPGATISWASKPQEKFVPAFVDRTREDGTFEVSGLFPGGYSVTVRHPEYVPEVGRIGIEILDKDPDFVKVKMRRGGRLQGKLLISRSSIPASTVLIKPIEGTIPASPQNTDKPLWPQVGSSSLPVEKDGQFRSPGLPPGLYEVQLKQTAPGGTSSSTKPLGQVEIRLGETTVLNVDLRDKK
jgi:RNA polymerase sigma-70 factor (ECF subfamily)